MLGEHLNPADEAQKAAKEAGLTLKRGLDRRVKVVGSDGKPLKIRDIKEASPELDYLLRQPNVANRVYTSLPPLTFQERMGEVYQKSAMPSIVKTLTKGLTDKPGTTAGATAALMATDAFAPELGIPLQIATGALGGLAGAEVAPDVEKAAGFTPVEEPHLQAAVEGAEMGGTGALLKGALGASEWWRSQALWTGVSAF